MLDIETNSEVKISVEEILSDYRLACESRNASLIGRKEVFMGKAKFGIFGDGKEVAQIAMAKAFKRGDIRSGYYRDMTFMFAIGELTIQQFFAQLYAHTDVEAEPASAGRLMNGHFATRMLDEDGHFNKLTESYNSASDVSCTAAQMPRLVGFAFASKVYRANKELKDFSEFSINGNEVAFGTIGDAATSEGIFLEAINAAGVLQIPMLVAIWDDGYGISVPTPYHTTRGDLTKALSGFVRTGNENGIEIFKVRGWDYEGLCDAFASAAALSRSEHVPTMVHVHELTQPQGHSTSGSHERYKLEDRLAWEQEYDCNVKFREWILSNGFASEEQLQEIEQEAQESAKKARDAAWENYIKTVKKDQQDAVKLCLNLAETSSLKEKITQKVNDLKAIRTPWRYNAIRTVKQILRDTKREALVERKPLIEWLNKELDNNYERYSSCLYSRSSQSALNVEVIAPQYSEGSPTVDGRVVINKCFDAAFERDPRLLAFGEDVGKIGDVNQGFKGLQDKYGEHRITDTGIRESTIIGQGIGAAIRGLRPIAEVQYLDYLVYTLQTLTDDLACLHYRTKAGQKAPMILRTRGHRLEGVWHSGSPMGMIINSLRGIYVLVPRNMTQAAGFYNTMLQSDDPAIIIECLNGYRMKEQLPDNIGEFTVPLGVPDVLREGNDVTIVTYGAMCKVVMEAASQLEEEGISCEVIDVQSLLPFDVHHTIVASLKKTNRIIFADEDVPGGASAFMMQQVLELQDGYHYLDSQPITIAAKEHRPAYGSDGDYFSKPNPEEVFDKVYGLMEEAKPKQFPPLYK